MLESTFQKQVLVILNGPNAEPGGIWIPFPRTKFGKSGVSDLVFVTAACELKAPGSKYETTPTQEAFIQRLNNHGGFARTIKSFAELGEYARAFSAVRKITP